MDNLGIKYRVDNLERKRSCQHRHVERDCQRMVKNFR